MNINWNKQQYELNNESLLFYMMAGYEASHAGMLVTNMTSSHVQQRSTNFGLYSAGWFWTVTEFSDARFILESASEWAFP